MKLIRFTVVTCLLLLLLTITADTVSADKVSYSDLTKTLTWKNDYPNEEFNLRLYTVYEYNESKHYDITVGGNVTKEDVEVKYYAISFVKIENCGFNDVILEILYEGREDLINKLGMKKMIKIEPGKGIYLPRDVKGYLGIYNISIVFNRVVGNQTTEVKYSLTLEIVGDLRESLVNITPDYGKDYSKSCVIGDDMFVKVNALGARYLEWEIVGLDYYGGVKLNSPNDEYWIRINSSELYHNYGLEPKRYTIHVTARNEYGNASASYVLSFSEPSLAIDVDPKEIPSGFTVNVELISNVISSKQALDGPENRGYIAVVRGIYTGGVNVTNDILNLTDDHDVLCYVKDYEYGFELSFTSNWWEVAKEEIKDYLFDLFVLKMDNESAYLELSKFFNNVTDDSQLMSAIDSAIEYIKSNFDIGLAMNVKIR